MRLKIVNSSKVLGGVNPKMKWSAEALMLVSEVAEHPTFSESDVAELVEGTVGKRALDEIHCWLRSGGAGNETPRIFFEKLGFSAANLSAGELKNLKSLLAKFVRPKLRELEKEKIELAKRIESLGRVIEMTKTSN